MLSWLIWNSAYAVTMAIVVRLVCCLQWAQRRPALIHLAWALVLARLSMPALVPLPVWSATKHAYHFPTATLTDSAPSKTAARLASEPSQVSNALQAAGSQSDMLQASHPDLITSPANFAIDPNSIVNIGSSARPASLDKALPVMCLLCLLWATGSVCLLIIAAVRHRRMASVVRCAELDSYLSSIARELSETMGGHRAPPVLIVSGHLSPALFGLFHPVILMPRWATERMSVESLRAALAHELAHYQRYDHWAVCFATFTQCIWWWNPVAWWAARQWQHWRELSCDAMVIDRANISVRSYAQTLLSVVFHLQEFHQAPKAALAVAGKANRLFIQRFRMLGVARRSSRISSFATGFVMCLSMLGLCYPSIGAALQTPDAFRYESLQPDKAEVPNFVDLSPEWPENSAFVLSAQLADQFTLTTRHHFYFGAADQPVLMALLQSSSDGPEKPMWLAVDMDHDSRIDAGEISSCVEPERWLVRLSVGSPDSAKRGNHFDLLLPRPATAESRDYQIVVRRDGDRLQVANNGRLHGILEIQGQRLTTVIEDRNCNGQWTDSDDRLTIDWNSDGQFSPLKERHSCQGTLNYHGQRYALAFHDDHLSAKAIEGTGRLKGALKLLFSTATIEQCSAVLASSDGVHVTLNSLDETIDVPPGEYSVQELRIRVKGERVWSMVFESSNRRPRDTVTVEQDQQSEFDLLGSLKLSATTNEQLYSMAALAKALLKQGSLDLAQELLKEVWDSHSELHRIVADRVRLMNGKNQAGIARLFGPIFSLIEPEKAIQLIEATAYAREIEPLKAEAIGYMANYRVGQWQAVIDSLPDSTQLAYGLLQYSEKQGVFDFSIAQELLRRLPDTNNKVALQLDLLERSQMSDSERRELARQTFATLRSGKEDAIPRYPRCQLAARGCKLTAALDSGLAEQFAFESLWHCEGTTTILAYTPITQVAANLAAWDLALARHLLTPCFDDWSWLFERDYWMYFTNNEPLQAALLIDPNWAVELATDLLKNELADQPSSKLETLFALTLKATELYRSNCWK